MLRVMSDLWAKSILSARKLDNNISIEGYQGSR